MKLISSLIVVLMLGGCITIPQAKISPAQHYPATLVYRHSKPIPSEATATITPAASKVPKVSLTDPNWLTRLEYKDIGAGLGAMIAAFNDKFPWSLLLGNVDDIADVFKQASTVELRRLDVVTQVEETEVWLPKNSTRVKVTRGELTVEVDGVDGR